ncbi:MAG: hypothetical protein MZV64_72650 [Ignavibacteriales bacterium]|nr:hypothetical protein [Ignavibacteriales bacterium]
MNAHRARLHGHRQHRGAPGGREPEPPDPRADPGRALGRAGRSRRARPCSSSSPASDYVNGHILVVDGGWLAR